MNRELVGALLALFGHDLSEAGGGAEAVRGGGADAVRPDPDGPADAGHGRPGRHPRDPRSAAPLNRATPIVALSANILPTHLEACRAAGMNDHIGKPIDTRELLTKIARWTGPDAPTRAAMESVA